MVLLNRVSLAVVFLATACVSLSANAALDWEAALSGEHRLAANAARDAHRHPRETLEFFGLREDMTVVELSPGGGWYTEVLAPVLKDNGAYFAAHNAPNGSAYSRRSLGAYLQKLGENNDVYSNVTVTTLAPPESVAIAPAGTADMVLAFRNVHSWMRADALAEAFIAAYDALKPGGVFGVVQHRAKDGRDVEMSKKTGYVTEDYVIAAAKSVGFELAGRSEVNANPKDTADYPKGVWELPPGLRGDAATRAAREAVGESDRMTLKFVKPAN
ncbi:MAG: class I SAM-dependent methyltransferase [Congregibacter sp.]